ncbi:MULTISPECIES: hypothetical protein [Lonsdalea]|uniref:hypothetical protein n=1 Tax=Lonsdalea TaxID=1082702 RepID=UPI0011BF4EB0|nr:MULTISPECIES: hypothetical protein [Lonsdalea]
MHTFSLRYLRPTFRVTEKLRSLWCRINPAQEGVIEGEWKHTAMGDLSFRARAFPLPSGGWGASIISRSGFHAGKYSFSIRPLTAGTASVVFRTQREAMAAAMILAEHLASLRYRYH